MRHYCVSCKDSEKIRKEKKIGVCTVEAAKYMSSIFGTTIISHIRDGGAILPYMDLDNGYGTIICTTFHDNEDELASHYFIIYKKDDILYYYDQSNSKTTTDINKIIKSFGGEKISKFCLYYNLGMGDFTLNKTKMKKSISF